MSVKDMEFFDGRHTKNCFVSLERLDEKSLYKYLRKYGLKLAPQGTIKQPTIDHPNQILWTANPKPIERKRLKRSGQKVRRKITKPLCYSDDEDFNVKNEIEADDSEGSGVFSESEAGGSSLPDRTVVIKSKPEGGNCEILTIEKENTNFPSMPLHSSEVKKLRMVERGMSESLFQNIPKDSCCGETDKCAVDSEIEVLKVLTRPSGLKDKAKADGKKSMESLNDRERRLSVTSVSKQQYELEEEDSRVSEDDKVTVIFEENFHKDTDLEELLELERKDLIGRTFKNREITNRKKQRLVKFKRKRMAGKNSSKYKIPKGKFPEAAGSEQAVSDKTTECSIEECLREVCCLVKRLHELYRTILQLQGQLPKNAELAVHFMRVINAQQENFHREIRKGQRTIIKCYEKMLNFYTDSLQVTSEISRRTSLSVSDVFNVVSRCILVEGQCEVEKHNAAPKQGALPPVKPSDGFRKSISEKLERLIKKKKGEDANSTQKPQPLNASPVFPPSHLNTLSGGINHRPELFHHPRGEIPAAWEPTTREKTLPSLHFQSKYSGPPYSDYQISGRGRAQTQQNCQPRPCSKDYIHEEFAQSWSSQINSERHSSPLRPPRNQQANLAVQYYDGFPAQSGTLYRQIFPRKSLPPPSSTSCSVVVPVFASPMPRYNRLPNREYQSSKKPDISSEVFSSVAPSVKTVRPGMVNTTAQMTRQGEVQSPLDTLSEDSFGVSAHNISSVRSGSVDTTMQLENSTSRDLRTVFDPTIPQKLTMRNCRLQAGPTLGVDIKVTEVTGELNPRRVEVDQKGVWTKFRNLDREDSTSRVYVCAQNDCKNPGVRICKGCQSVIYCSAPCQFKHWTLKHRAECYQLKALRG